MVLSESYLPTEFYSQFKIFHEIMSIKIREILLVASSYDAFILEEDGSLASRIINEYSGLNLSMPPRVTRTSSAGEALILLNDRAFDLVITMPNLDDMDAFSLGIEVKKINPNLPVILNDRDFRSRIERAVEPLQRQERKLITTFEKTVAEAGFSLVQGQAGMVARPQILPVVEEKPVPLEQLSELAEQGVLTEEDIEKLSKAHGELTERFRDVFQEVADIRHRVQERVEDVRRKLLQPAFDTAVARIRKLVGDDRADGYLDAVAKDLGEMLELFMVSPFG